MKKNPTGNLKNYFWGSLCAVKIVKDSTFSQVLLRDFAETFQNGYWEKCTCQWHSPEIYGYFSLIVIIFLGRHRPNKENLDANNKKIKKFTWRRCSRISIMNLDQLIFTCKGRHLVLALFTSYIEIHSHVQRVFRCCYGWKLLLVRDEQRKLKEFLCQCAVMTIIVRSKWLVHSNFFLKCAVTKLLVRVLHGFIFC